MFAVLLACLPLISASYILCDSYPEPTNLNSCIVVGMCAWCPQENICVDDCYASCINASFGEGCKEQSHEEYILNVIIPCVVAAIFLIATTVVAVCVWKYEIRRSCRDEEAPLVEPESETYDTFIS